MKVLARQAQCLRLMSAPTRPAAAGGEAGEGNKRRRAPKKAKDAKKKAPVILTQGSRVSAVRLDDPTQSHQLLCETTACSEPFLDFVSTIGGHSAKAPMLRVKNTIYWLPLPAIPAVLACHSSLNAHYDLTLNK